MLICPIFFIFFLTDICPCGPLGEAVPDVAAHVKVAGFGADVKVFNSVMLPKLLVVHGDDGREYPFMVRL